MLCPSPHSTNVVIWSSMPSPSWSTLLHFLEWNGLLTSTPRFMSSAGVFGPMDGSLTSTPHYGSARVASISDVMRYMIVFHRYRNHSTNRDHSIPGAHPAAARPASDIFSPTP